MSPNNRVSAAEMGLKQCYFKLLGDGVAAKVFDGLQNWGQFERPNLPRFKCPIPRGQALVYWGNNEDSTYKYSGIKLTSRRAPAVLDELHRKVEEMAGHPFEYAIINEYLPQGQNGEDCVNFHRDLAEARDGTDIFSYSLGGHRYFRVKTDEKQTPFRWCKVELESDMLLVIPHSVNSTCLHAVTRSTKSEIAELGEKRMRTRYNITFRRYLQ